MKTLVNKHNPAIRIIAPKIKIEELPHDYYAFFSKKDWTLVEEPAEWNEEDRRKLNRIYEILGHAADDKGFLTSKRIIGDKEAIELQDFLKSLRPQSKVEEEPKKQTSEYFKELDYDKQSGQQEPEYYQHFDPDC